MKCIFVVRDAHSKKNSGGGGAYVPMLWHGLLLVFVFHHKMIMSFKPTFFVPYRFQDRLLDIFYKSWGPPPHTP